MRFLFKTGYDQDVRLFQHSGQVYSYGLLGAVLLLAPWWAGDYVMSQLHFILIYSIVGFGLMMLVGFTGQISLGHAAFLAVGAYTEALLQAAGVPFVVSISCAALFSAVAGLIVGLPALRLKGIYLAIATLAFNVIVEEIITRWESLTGGNSGKHLKPVDLFGLQLDTDAGFYYLCLVLTVLCGLACVNLLRSPTGRAFVAIRDSEISASCLGVNLARYKTMSFAFSAALTGVGGALYAHKLAFISPEQFTLFVSIELVTIVKDFRSEAREDGGQGRSAGRDCCSRQQIRIDGWHSKALELGADHALARGDAAGQSDALHPPNSAVTASFAGDRRSSTNVFHSWHCGHCQSNSVLRYRQLTQICGSR